MIFRKQAVKVEPGRTYKHRRTSSAFQSSDSTPWLANQRSAGLFSEELAWSEHKTAPFLGIVILDRTGGDFGGNNHGPR